MWVYMCVSLKVHRRIEVKEKDPAEYPVWQIWKKSRWSHTKNEKTQQSTPRWKLYRYCQHMFVATLHLFPFAILLVHKLVDIYKNVQECKSRNHRRSVSVHSAHLYTYTLCDIYTRTNTYINITYTCTHVTRTLTEFSIIRFAW